MAGRSRSRTIPYASATSTTGRFRFRSPMHRQHNVDKPPMTPMAASGPNTNDTLPPGDISDLAHLLRSPPPVPSSPAPAYTALPYRDVDYYLAPLMNGRVGEIELNTTDGKRFLVHRKVLEQETVFFHIYYGFVPVWRLANPHIGPPHPNLPSAAPVQPASTSATGAINNLLCLPKFIASHLRTAPSARQSHDDDGSTSPLLSSNSTSEPMDTDSYDHPPPPPPKDVTAPTPTTSPYTWAVPEDSSILASFLSLIYPRGTFAVSAQETMPTLDVTSRVIRASMGYQSSKALALARDRLHTFITTQPLETYALACFFKFTDLSRLASQMAISVHPDAWSSESKGLMGKRGMNNLMQLRDQRLAGLRGILNGGMEVDAHSETCVRSAMVREVWDRKTAAVKAELKPESELLELLEVDLRGGHCGDCLLLLGGSIQRCLLAARELPSTV